MLYVLEALYGTQMTHGAQCYVTDKQPACSRRNKSKTGEVGDCVPHPWKQGSVPTLHLFSIKGMREEIENSDKAAILDVLAGRDLWTSLLLRAGLVPKPDLDAV